MTAEPNWVDFEQSWLDTATDVAKHLIYKSDVFNGKAQLSNFWV